MRTRLSDLDVFDEVAEAVIGHAPSSLTRTYSKSDRLNVKLDALRRWEGELRRITKGKCRQRGQYNGAQASGSGGMMYPSDCISLQEAAQTADPASIFDAVSAYKLHMLTSGYEQTVLNLPPDVLNPGQNPLLP